MQDLLRIWNRLVDSDLAPKAVSLVLDEGGLFSVRVDWPGRSKECRRATTAREAVQVAMDDLMEEVYSRKPWG